MTKTKLLAKAIKEYGREQQIEMAIEEAGELIVALQHYKRGRQHDVIEDIADMRIMLDQLTLMFDEGRVVNKEGEKLERLWRRLRERI